MAWKNGKWVRKKGVKYSSAVESRVDLKPQKFGDKSYDGLDNAISIFAYFINDLGQKIEIKALQNSESPITDKNGLAVWLKFKVENKTTFVKRTEWAYYNLREGKAYLKNLNIHISTQTRGKVHNNGWAGHLDSEALAQRSKRSKISRR